MASAALRVLRVVTQRLSRLYPLYSGCGTLANSPFYRFLSSSAEVVETPLRDGSVIRVHLNDFIGRSLFFFGDLDPKISWLCRRVLRRGDTMLDVGANYGLIALQAARLVGAPGQVHAFEPQEDLADLFLSSCARNGYRQVTVHRLGLSDTDAVAPLRVPLHNRGRGSVNRESVSGRTLSIPLKNGSAYLRGLALPKVRLVKVDVEGHEAAVFTGACAWLREAQPEVLVFENTEEALPFWHRPPVRVLADLDYDFFGIPRVKFRMGLERIPAHAPAVPRFHDVVAVARWSSFHKEASG
jgi:FkbM family methyltransferase